MNPLSLPPAPSGAWGPLGPGAGTADPPPGVSWPIDSGDRLLPPPPLIDSKWWVEGWMEQFIG